MDGKPLKEAHVWFVMEGKRDALGVTDDEGRYEVVSSRTQAGAPIGLNKVRIETSLWNNAGIPIKGAIIVPEKFRDPAKTELSAEVKAGANTFDFDLVGGKIQQ